MFAFSDDFASLYAMITAIDKIEKAYMNSAVASAAYDASCSELIAKFKTLRTVTEDSVPDVQHFMATYMMHCNSARHRLQVGVPATVEHRVERSEKRTNIVSVAECVHHYIGAMDTLKLNMFAKDQLAPCLSDLLLSIYKVPQLPPEFIGKTSLRRWSDKLDCMRASDEIDIDESRQLLYDIELSYNQFMQLLGGHDIIGHKTS